MMVPGANISNFNLQNKKKSYIQRHKETRKKKQLYEKKILNIGFSFYWELFFWKMTYNIKTFFYINKAFW